MILKSKFFSQLTTGELYEILKARAEIFVVEQSCVYNDLDGRDYESLHVFFEEEGQVQACLRAFLEEEGTARMGRVLTLEHGKGLGGQILRAGISEIREKLHAQKIRIHAQCYAVPFYEREGFKIASAEFLEDGIPHVGMELTFEEEAEEGDG